MRVPRGYADWNDWQHSLTERIRTIPSRRAWRIYFPRPWRTWTDPPLDFALRTEQRSACVDSPASYSWTITLNSAGVGTLAFSAYDRREDPLVYRFQIAPGQRIALYRKLVDNGYFEAARRRAHGYSRSSSARLCALGGSEGLTMVRAFGEDYRLPIGGIGSDLVPGDCWRQCWSRC